ncbi:T9SS type A sorting domain-containing protein [Winogradskyella sp.]|uniref:T9SS type A sorting domain-containing protein n=1 Tax=Winogradskyella sp. TaxID=1883156 RepID=UPI003BA9BEDE
MKKITFILLFSLIYVVGFSQGEDCNNPIVINSLPYNTTDDTSNYGDNYGTTDRPALGGEQYVDGTGDANYLTGDDVTYAFTPSADGTYSFELSGIGTWVGFWLFEGCPFTSIVARHTATGSGTRSLPSLNLVSGTTYYLVISTWPSPQTTSYTLDVSQITCPAPSSQDATNITTDSADLSWTENGAATVWDIEIVDITAAGTATGTPTVTGVTNPYTAMSLTPNNDYEYYVRADCSGDFSDWVGPFAFTTLATCPVPTALTATNIAPDSADISWTAGGTETLWNIELVDITAMGTATGTPTFSGVSNPTALMGLTADNAYEYYVQADCGGGDVSDWVGPFAFTTPCTAISAPYTEDFEAFTVSSAGLSNENCWNATNIGGYVWEVAATTDTSSTGTGPGSGVSDGNYLFTEATSGSQGDAIDLTSPLVDLTPLTAPGLYFDYHMFGSDMGTLEVIVSSGGMDTTAFTLSGEQQTDESDPFITQFVDLSPYAGQTVSVTFRGTKGPDFRSDMAVDNVIFNEAPSCFAEAGTLTADATPVQLDGITTISATPNGDIVVPPDYDVTYVLTSPGLVIEAASATPSFDVTVANDYIIHTLVAETTDNTDPNFLDLSVIVFGTTTGTDVLDIVANNMLCAALDVTGAPITVGCIVDAGTLTADETPVQLDGTTTISATPNGDSVVPTDFDVTYVLTSPGLVIEAASATPSFDVTVANDYIIHTLVAETTDNTDPNYLDLSVIVFGTTTGTDVLDIVTNNSLCAALDVTGAPITVAECIADAGTLTADAAAVLLDGTTTISATPNGDIVVPTNYDVTYVLTSPGLVIEAASATPSFDVTVANDYIIHTLVAETTDNTDPNFLDLSVIVFGTTTGADVLDLVTNNMLCAALDVTGASVSVLDISSLPELLIVDLTVTNEVTITAGAGLSLATDSGSDTTGCLLADFFVNAGTQSIDPTLVTGTLTSASETSDSSPDLFRGGTGGIDVGLNIWTYTNDPTSNFTVGQVAFSGQGTWTLTTDEYNAFITAPTSGAIYFPADTTDDIPGATLIGGYTVALPLSVPEVEGNAFSYYPNPVENTLTLKAQNTIETVTMYNMLGQEVLRATPNSVDSNIDMSGLQTGAYFVKVTIANTTQTVRVIKQ